MRDKNVKTPIIPFSDKTPKRLENPESYKNSLVSWQFNMMDYDFEYGWKSVFEQIKLESVEDLLLELIESGSTDDSLYNSLELCAYKSYSTFPDLWNFISKKNNKISVDDLRIVSKHIKVNFFWDNIFPKLKDFESLRWEEFERQRTGKKGKSKHHKVSINKLIKPAQQRLVELKLDDYEELFSIRLSSTQRIWGIQEGTYLKLLWFDAFHEICPSKKKNT